MFNKFALVITGLMLTVSSVGCCCLHGAGGYGAGYRPMGCPPCNNSCPPAGGYYQQGAFYQGDMTQSAYVSGVSQSAMVPVQSASLPLTTAAAPGAIQGPPIYAPSSTAVLPGAALPLY